MRLEILYTDVDLCTDFRYYTHPQVRKSTDCCIPLYVISKRYIIPSYIQIPTKIVD